MDESKIAYFAAKFGAYDDDELRDLVARRDDLADEAIAALDRVLSSKGLNTSEAIKVAQPSLTINQETGALSLEEKTKTSRELWRGKLSTVCTVMMMLTFVAPVQNFVRGRQIGALWVTLLVLSVGYLGAKVGRSITKNICADSEMSIAAKRKRLWLFLAAMFPIYFIVFSITTAMAGH